MEINSHLPIRLKKFNPNQTNFVRLTKFGISQRLFFRSRMKTMYFDAGATLKSLLKASCRKPRKPNFEILTTTKVIAILCVLHLFWIYEVPEVFSVPNEDHVLPDAGFTLKRFLKAPCRKSRKPNFEFLIITKVISILTCITTVLGF